MFRLPRKLRTTLPNADRGLLHPGEHGFQWLGLDVVGILLVAFLVLPLAAVGTVRTGEVLGFYHRVSEGAAALAALFVQEIGLLGVTLASVTRGYARPLSSIGFIGRGWLRELGLGAIAAVPLFLVQEAGMSLALRGFRLFLPAQRVAALLAQENEALGALVGRERHLALAFTAVLVLLAPLAEEVFFRGFVQTVLRERVGRWGGALAVALLFALIHRYVLQFLPVFAVGLLLSLLAEWRGSLTAGITAHALLNLVALLNLLKDLP